MFYVLLWEVECVYIMFYVLLWEVECVYIMFYVLREVERV